MIFYGEEGGNWEELCGMTVYQRKAGFQGDAVSPCRVARCSGFPVEGNLHSPLGPEVGGSLL